MIIFDEFHPQKTLRHPMRNIWDKFLFHLKTCFFGIEKLENYLVVLDFQEFLVVQLRLLVLDFQEVQEDR